MCGTCSVFSAFSFSFYAFEHRRSMRATGFSHNPAELCNRNGQPRFAGCTR
jgi:hypothetical protein